MFLTHACARVRILGSGSYFEHGYRSTWEPWMGIVAAACLQKVIARTYRPHHTAKQSVSIRTPHTHTNPPTPTFVFFGVGTVYPPWAGKCVCYPTPTSNPPTCVLHCVLRLSFLVLRIELSGSRDVNDTSSPTKSPSNTGYQP